MKKITVLLLALFSSFMLSIEANALSSDIVGPNVIHKEMNQALTITDILSYYETDVMILEDGYTGHGNMPGEYTITLKQSTNTKDITVYVIQNWGDLQSSQDIIAVTDYKDIYVVNSRVLTPYEIIYYIFMKTGYFENTSNFYYESQIDTYTVNVNEDNTIDVGVYQFSFRATFFTGYEATYSSTIHVVQSRQASGIILEPPQTSSDKFIDALPWIVGALLIGYFIYKKLNKQRGWNF